MNAQEMRHVKCRKEEPLANSSLNQITVENKHVYDQLDYSLNYTLDTPRVYLVCRCTNEFSAFIM